MCHDLSSVAIVYENSPLFAMIYKLLPWFICFNMVTMLLCLLIMLYLLSCLIITYRARQVPSVVDPYLEGHGDLVSISKG